MDLVNRTQAASLTSSLTEIQVARVVPVTAAEGPGDRFAVWVQGCSIRCVDCFNPHLWTEQGGQGVKASDLIGQALSAKVEGVTLLGGEPVEQASALAVFCEGVRDAGLSVMTFTGYTLLQLRERVASGNEGIRALLAQTDLLVDGPYVADKPDHGRPWAGSTNQQFHFLTPRYAHLKDHLSRNPDRLEIRVDPQGRTSVNGWASTDALEVMLAGLGVRDDRRRRADTSQTSRNQA